jgi:hypothetical protein
VPFPPCKAPSKWHQSSLIHMCTPDLCLAVWPNIRTSPNCWASSPFSGDSERVMLLHDTPCLCNTDAYFLPERTLLTELASVHLSGYPERVMLLYDGLHYDAMSVSPIQVRCTLLLQRVSVCVFCVCMPVCKYVCACVCVCVYVCDWVCVRVFVCLMHAPDNILLQFTAARCN